MQTLGRLINPIPYLAEIFVEKIRFEKIVMYGVVHVVVVDGYSRKIVGFCTMPRKNPITILGTIFRPLLRYVKDWHHENCAYVLRPYV